jgi:hypothetical protein
MHRRRLLSTIEAVSLLNLFDYFVEIPSGLLDFSMNALLNGMRLLRSVRFPDTRMSNNLTVAAGHARDKPLQS